MIKTKSIYIQVKELSLPLIKSYQTDLLKHDRRIIRQNPGVPFIHTTTEYGTHIVLLHGPDTYPGPGEQVKYLFGYADRYHILNQNVDFITYYPSQYRDSSILYYDGRSTVKKITLAQAGYIARDYKHGILDVWENKTNRQAA